MTQQSLINPVTSVANTCNLCGSINNVPLFRKSGYELVKCRDCELVFVANPPPVDAVDAFYTATANYHDELLKPGDPSFARMEKIASRHLKAVIHSVPDPSDLRLLDIGCSSGLFLNLARNAGFVVEGVELSPETSAFAHSHFGLDVRCGKASEMDFGDCKFDVITMFDVIEHLPDPRAELRMLHGLLNPGGMLILSTPNIDGLFPRVSRRLARLLDYWPHPEPPHHLYQFSVHTLGEMTKTAGFAPMRVEHTRIGLDYSFGTPDHWRISKKLVPYAMLFAPSAILGPWIGMGDWFYLSARSA